LSPDPAVLTDRNTLPTHHISPGLLSSDNSCRPNTKNTGSFIFLCYTQNQPIGRSLTTGWISQSQLYDANCTDCRNIIFVFLCWILYSWEASFVSDHWKL